ncbi:MAG: hypothetical protein FWE38_02115 [Firmicutes bacterium]|nr:hypothetical protein [Bacillota bacterium]
MGNLMAKMAMRVADIQPVEGAGGSASEVVGNVVTVVQTVFNVLLGLLGMAALVFAIYIGFKLASAEDEGKRKEAKKQLLWTIIAVIAVVLLIVIFNILIGAISNEGSEITDWETF